MYYVSVYNRQEQGRQEQSLEAGSLERAEVLRSGLAESLAAHFDIIIEEHAHPVEYHEEPGEHDDYVIGTADGRLGAWPKTGQAQDFVAVEKLAPELRDHCGKYTPGLPPRIEPE